MIDRKLLVAPSEVVEFVDTLVGFPPAVSMAVTHGCLTSQNHILLKTREVSKQYLHLYFPGTSQTYSQSLHLLLTLVFGEIKKEMCILSNLPGHLAVGLLLQIFH